MKPNEFFQVFNEEITQSPSPRVQEKPNVQSPKANNKKKLRTAKEEGQASMPASMAASMPASIPTSMPASMPVSMPASIRWAVCYESKAEICCFWIRFQSNGSHSLMFTINRGRE